MKETHQRGKIRKQILVILSAPATRSIHLCQILMLYAQHAMFLAMLKRRDLTIQKGCGLHSPYSNLGLQSEANTQTLIGGIEFQFMHHSIHMTKQKLNLMVSMKYRHTG